LISVGLLLSYRAKCLLTIAFLFVIESEENRTAVMRAALGARRPKDAYVGEGEKEVKHLVIM